MNKTFTLLILVLILSNTVTAQQPEFQWVRNMGGSYIVHLLSMNVDTDGNVYSTGNFTGTADFDPGQGTYNLTSAGTYNQDGFISKLDASGNFVWAKQIGGTQSESGNSIAMDAYGNVYTLGGFSGTVDFDPGAGAYNLTSASYTGFICKLDTDGNFIWAKQFGNNTMSSIAVDASGNVYTTGLFTGTTDFDPGTTTYNLSSAGSVDHFVSKWDTDGNFIWAKQFAGKSTGNESYLTLDGAGNVYITGTFFGTVDFDPGPGTHILIPPGYASEIFVCKLDADGNFIWAKNMGGTGHEYGRSIAVDASGNVYTTGSFAGTADFDPDAGAYNLTAAGNYDIFISKLDVSGNFLWAKRMGSDFVPSVLPGALEEGKSIAIDVSGNIYTTGSFTQTADFDPGAGTYNLTSAGDCDIFISKLNANGNFIWAGDIGASGSDNGRAISLDASGNFYTAGDFQGIADFNPLAGVSNLTAVGSVDIFVLKMSDGCMSGGGLIISATQDTICRGTPAVLNVTGALGNIQWQSSVTGNNFTGIQGATEVSYTSQDTANSYFRVYTSDANCPDTSNVFKLVVQPSPIADFISSSSGTDITFTDKSKGATIYDWDFGDGSTGTEQNPVHTYASAGSYRVCLTVFNGSNCSFTTCRDIEAGIGTGVTLIETDNQFKIYPNPFSGSITIEQANINNTIESIEIYDLLGRRVYGKYQTVQTENAELQTINLSNLVSSMYFVKVKTTGKEDSLFRLVKN